MYPFMRVTIGVVVTCFAIILVQNLNGFFVSPEDDPVFKDSSPAAAEGAAGEGGAANQAGAKVFTNTCASCHQPNGKGIPGVYPPLGGSAFVQADPAIPVRIVLHGFKGEIIRNGTNYNGVMTPFHSALSDQEIADVLTYVRSSFGNSASEIDAATVTEIRGQTVGHSGPFTEAELQNAAAM